MGEESGTSYDILMIRTITAAEAFAKENMNSYLRKLSSWNRMEM